MGPDEGSGGGGGAGGGGGGAGGGAPGGPAGPDDPTKPNMGPGTEEGKVSDRRDGLRLWYAVNGLGKNIKYC
jgi:hypothetical protein